MSDYAALLDALRNLKAQSSDGFEGLIRDCLESLSKRTLRLKKSGHQGGNDMLSDHDLISPLIALESKRFGAKTALPQDELEAKLKDTLHSSPEIDIWGLVLSREMQQPDWSNLQKIGAEYGVTLLCLDWRDEPGSLPIIAVICAAARHIAEKRLSENLAPTFDKITEHPDFKQLAGDLSRQLTATETGFDLTRHAAHDWLKTVLSSTTASRQYLRNHADLLSSGSHCISRPGVEQQLSDWWTSGNSVPAVLLGDEGRGKTWVALKWCIDVLDKTNALLAIVLSAKDVQQGDAGDVLSSALKRCLPLVETSNLKRRLFRWAQSHRRLRILLIVDGLNERWTVNWNDFVKLFEVEPWKEVVTLLLTSRSTFWRDDLLQLRAAAESPITEIRVPELNDVELDQYLDTYKLSRAQLPSSLLGLIRIPRFARLAITLRDQLCDQEDLTEARLILEDWRSRLNERDLRVDDEGLLRFVADLGKEVLADKEFSISEKEIHSRLSADSGRDLEHYRAAINEIVEGLWLIRGERAHRYKVSTKLLPYVIGLDLARSIESLTERPAINDVIAKYQEQLRGADIGVAILRAATSTSFSRQKATTAARSVLLEAWINSQNFRPIDFEEMWPLISRNHCIFLEVAERTWKVQPVGRGEGEILAKGLANAAKWPAVKNELTDRLPRWIGAYGNDPVRWFYGARFPGNDHRRDRTQANLADWRSVEADYPRKITTHLRPDEDDWLPEAALTIISYLERQPFVETLVTWAITRAIMEYDVGVEEFDWLLRLNSEDHSTTENEIIKEAELLRKLSVPVAKRAADILLAGVATPRAMIAKGHTETKGEEFTHRETWPKLNQNNVVSWPDHKAVEALRSLQWMERLSTFAINPNASLSDQDQLRLRKMMADFAEGRRLETKSPFECEAYTLFLSRWSPNVLGQLVREAFAELPKREIESHAYPIGRIEETSLVVKAEQKDSVLKQARADLDCLAFYSGDEGRRMERHLKDMIVASLIGKSADEQIKALKAFLPSFNFSRTLLLLMAEPKKEDFRGIFSMLAKETDEIAIRSWLGYLEEMEFKDVPSERDVLLALARHENKDVRGQAIFLIWSAKIESLGTAFVDTGWSHTKGQERLEALCGTHLVCKFGAHLDFESARQRIVPQALPHLVESRGSDERELRALHDYALELLDEEITGNRKARYGYPYVFQAKEAWRKIVRMDGGVIIKKARGAAAKGHALGFFNIFPLVELMKAILAESPADGAEIWRLAKAAHDRVGLHIADFDHLRFAKSEHTEVSRLRRDALHAAKNDAELADSVLLCLSNGHEDWLIEVIRDALSQSNAGQIARGLTMAGFLNCTEKANELWKNEIDLCLLSGWLDQVRAAAWRAYQKNNRAQYWFEEFLATTDPDRAFGFFNLFTQCLDSRSLLWISPTVNSRREHLPRPWLNHFDVKTEARKRRRKKVDDERKKTLFFTPISGSMSPWL